jgi:hypothetical protein
VTDVGFMPIPGPLEQTIAGLMSVQLPPGVPHGKTYKVVLRQVSGRTYRVLGTTEFRIQVQNAEELLSQFLHNLAVLKHIALSIPADNRWYPVFQRYLHELGERIRAFGGDPGQVHPSPHGHGTVPREPAEREETETISGKVSRLYYDCFGDFEGFTVTTCDERKRFKACEPDIEEVVRKACRDRSRITILTEKGKENQLTGIFVHCC